MSLVMVLPMLLTGLGLDTYQNESSTLDNSNIDAKQSECAPDPYYVKKARKIGLKKAIRKVSINSIKNSKVENNAGGSTKTMVIGNSADTQTIYMKKFLTNYLAFGYYFYPKIEQYNNGTRKYYASISRFQSQIKQKQSTKIETDFDFEKIELKLETKRKIYSGNFAKGHSHCSLPVHRILVQGCVYHTWIDFEIDKEAYDYIAKSNPAELVEANLIKNDGTYRECPAYYSPIAFQAADMALIKHYKKLQK